MCIRLVPTLFRHSKLGLLIAFGAGVISLSSMLTADQLNVAQNKLELTATVKNNLFYLLDNSGSMDFEVITNDYLSSGLLLSAQPDGGDLLNSSAERQIVHRAGCEKEATLFGGYAYGVASPTNAYHSLGPNCFVAAADSWRFRNAQYNPLYFDPSLKYEPWPGEDINGARFVDYRQHPVENSLFVPLEPFDSSRGLVDLLSDNPVTGCFRYYKWIDDGDGKFENGEQIERLLANQSTDIKGNYANWFVYHRSRFLRAKGAIAHSVMRPEVMRAGFALTQSDSGGNILPIVDLSADSSSINKQQLLKILYAVKIKTRVNALPADSKTIIDVNTVSVDQFDVGTPLRVQLDNARRYLSCNSGGSLPGLFDANSCPLVSAGEGGRCQTHQLVLVSDGFYNGLRPAPEGNEDAFSGGINRDASLDRSAFDGGAFADAVSQSLADQTMRAYKVDFASGPQGMKNEVVPAADDILLYPRSSLFDRSSLMHQHIKTHMLTFGNNRFVLPQDPQAIFQWRLPSASDLGLLEDVRHAAYNGRGHFIQLNNGQSTNIQVADDLVEAIGHSAFPAEQPITTQAIISDGVLFQTFFNPINNTGDVRAFAALPNGGFAGEPDWSAALLLDSKIAANDDSRKLFTYSDDGSVPVGGRLFNASSFGLSEEQIATLDRPVPQTATSVAVDRLNYLRGQFGNEGSQFDESEFRVRPQVAGKMGSVENSLPVLVEAPAGLGRVGGEWPAENSVYFNFQREHADRDGTLYFGANSGIFHAINAGSGEERFGYVPNLLFKNLSKLTRPDYQHRYFVDGKPVANDVFIRRQGTLSWRTVVVSGLGAGGRGYFALDVTDPNLFTTDSVLWEISTQDDVVAGLQDGIGSHLGLSLGSAQMIMTNSAHFSDSNVKQWAVVFGNGVNNTSIDGNAVIYIALMDDLELNNKPRLIKVDTGVGYSAEFDTPNGIVEVRAVDVDGNGTADRLYAGDLQGNLYAIDISDTNPQQWASSPKIVFTARFNGRNSAEDRQPIVSRPIVLPHPTGNGLLVSFSTGTFFQLADTTDDSVQSIYGIWDDFSGDEVRFNNLVKQQLTNHANSISATANDIPVVRSITDNPVNWTQGNSGWYVNLNVKAVSDINTETAGERVVGDSVLLGGNLFFNTSLPRNDSCEPGGGGFNLALNPFTGGEPLGVVFDANNDGEFDEQDSIQMADSIAVISGTKNDAAIRSNIFYKGKLGVLNDFGELFSIGINIRDDRYLGRRAWREIEDYE